MVSIVEIEVFCFLPHPNWPHFDKKNGQNVIGVVENIKDNNYYGITFKKAKRNVPSK